MARRRKDSKPVGDRRREELTFRHNVTAGRHGWLRLTPAYSAKAVEDILDGRGADLSVLDPFSGTGTTALCAAARGLDVVAVDLNPFLVWLAQAKVRRYRAGLLAEVRRLAEKVAAAGVKGSTPRAEPPPIRNVQRWWSEGPLDGLCRLKGAMDRMAGEPGPKRDLLLVAFCRTLIGLSNAAFDHQSMSFAPESEGSSATDASVFAETFLGHVATVLEGAAEPLEGEARIFEGDAREIAGLVDPESFDLVVTSPPYPNRMSYVRELRPYMYWLGYLEAPRDAGELDWRAIGGTWGVATSRVARWKPSPGSFVPDYLAEAVERIGDTDTRSAGLLASYVGKYFEDMWIHLRGAVAAMRPGGELHYVVGNSKFYDVVVPAERVFADMLTRAGARGAEIRRLRKRTSKKELYEFDVVGRV